MTHANIVHRAAKLDMTLTWDDGTVTEVSGAHLLVRTEVRTPEWGLLGIENPQVRDLLPPVTPARNLTVSIDLDGHPGTELRVTQRPRP